MRPTAVYRSVAILAFILCAIAAFAKPPFLRVFVETYGIKDDSKIGKARCLVCHQPPGPPARNAYGATVGAALAAANQRMVTADILKSIENKNDGDGVSFISKIKSDVLPADPKPVVKKDPPKKPVQPAKKPSKAVKAKTKKSKRKLVKKKIALIPQSANGAAWVMLSIAPIGLLAGKRALRNP